MAQLRYRQDLPPKGGYAGITWQKNLPTRGISGVAMFLLCGGVMSAGFTLLIRHQRKRRFMHVVCTLLSALIYMPVYPWAVNGAARMNFCAVAGKQGS